jgi:hypothetical protein
MTSTVMTRSRLRAMLASSSRWPGVVGFGGCGFLVTCPAVQGVGEDADPVVGDGQGHQAVGVAVWCSGLVGGVAEFVGDACQGFAAGVLGAVQLLGVVGQGLVQDSVFGVVQG